MFDMYEIDPTITLLDGLHKSKITYGDFLTQSISTTYMTIIGNPPYVKTSKGNLYLDFIRKCFRLLRDDGELIFIVPSDFLKLTSSAILLNEMLSQGTFSHIIHPDREDLFTHAAIDIIIFRYCRNPALTNLVIYNDQVKYLINTNGIITFSDDASDANNSKKIPLSNYFNCYVGMVTGKESVFKNSEFGNINLLNNKDKRENYILIDKFPTQNEALNNYLNSQKEALINRSIRKFNENNWFEWGALRNVSTIKREMSKPCIYVNNLSRNKEIAFVDKVSYFGGGLLMLIPNQPVDLVKMTAYLNSDRFRRDYTYSGRFKIGQRQLINSLCKFSQI